MPDSPTSTSIVLVHMLVMPVYSSPSPTVRGKSTQNLRLRRESVAVRVGFVGSVHHRIDTLLWY